MTGRGQHPSVPAPVPVPAPRVLRCGDRTFELGLRTYLMGVVNITPDSFSDGGLHLAPAAAYDHAMRLLEQGADVIDLGAESTRPGATPVGVDEELRRLIPVIERLSAAGVRCLSIDTSKAEVARASLDLGAAWINDVDGLRDPAMATAARDADAVVVMHQQSMNPSAADDDVTYRDVVEEVRAHLAARIGWAVAAGVRRDRIVVDPGIGFGKTIAHNVELLARSGELSSLEPVLVGPSRKRFLRALSAASSLEQLDTATVGACCLAVFGGADLVRVHAVGEVRRALTIVDAARTATT